MIETFSPKKSGFETIFMKDGWKAAFITHSEAYDALREMKRHLLTEEVFTLLEGSASIFTLEENLLTETPMEKGKVYVIGRGTFHHVKTTPDALLFVAENSDTSKENTERMDYYADKSGN